MRRICHGTRVSLEDYEEARAEVHGVNARLGLPFSLASPPDLTRFDYLFPDLQEDEASLLPESPSTVAFLTALGTAMKDVNHPDDIDEKHSIPDSTIPSAYTYFGQFVDHDITLELQSKTLASLTDPALAPLPLATVREKLKNGRSATLDLDSLYGAPAPRDGAEMRLGPVSRTTNVTQQGPPREDEWNDLPRNGRSKNPTEDRTAQIGDSRNDVNLIVAQLHVAFLRAHNQLVRQGRTQEEAERLLRQHYQWIVIHDFLERIADPEIVRTVRTKGYRGAYDPFAEPFFLPLEFTVAAYRFGHSMVRKSYGFNRHFPSATLGELFTFTALSGGFDSSLDIDRDTLPENWIIEWEGFLDDGTNRARPIDTRLVEPLSELRNEVGGPLEGDSRLAVRNLLRGYLLRMPTGQAVAKKLKLRVLTDEEILNAAAVNSQRKVLFAARFLQRTPLWYYILAEAWSLGKDGRLGPVGSMLVAEVLVGLVRRSQDSILATDDWTPSLGNGGDFKLPALLRLAGVLS